MYLPGRCAITITICHKDAAGESYTPETYRRIQTSLIARKINQLMYMDDIKSFAKNENNWKTLIRAVKIYSDNVGI